VSARSIALLGSTGSIGTQAVDVVRGAPDRFRVVALAAGGGRTELLADQVAELGVRLVAVADPAAQAPLEKALVERGVQGVELLVGTDAASAVASRGADVEKTLALAEKYCIVSKAVRGEGLALTVVPKPA
jgi:1-deoxy-D-xylulose-5-phosphate reductoisomerase